jgi:hypothetical protein
MQNTYREIAVDIQSRDPDMAFAELEELVDHHLQAKSNQ